MSKNVLIVESPAKVKSISKVLGSDFTVLASYGHVRDLPSKNGSVDTENDFAMRYQVIERNERHVQDIARAMKSADTLWLATDLDREGEAISWHIHEILAEKKLLKGKTVHRIVFPEITPRAIKEAVAHPRALSLDLINAQQARRALDYLVGFNLSPLLWRKVQPKLSAGRVQTPALRMIVEREELIEAFVPREYWTIEAALAAKEVDFGAKLIEYQGNKLDQFDLNTEALATAARDALNSAASGKLKVQDVKKRDRQRRAAPPFTTSTLQQEAARKLGFGTQRAMRVAQGLYEGVAVDGGQTGLITYMRTDSVSLSREALDEVREVVAKQFGTDYVPETPNFYQTKSKSAQEAHEAIRPTSALRTPKSIAKYLNDDQRKLYELIWKRTLASQMRPALLNTVSIDMAAGNAGVFRSTGTTVIFPGFLAVYEEGRDTRGDDDDEARKLPPLEVGELVDLNDIAANQHFTEPPPRYSEASLVKALEEHGIGRPSTYASIIQTLIGREYVRLESKRFYPSDVGRAVANFLSTHFTKYVDYDFTAKMEDDLDEVANGAAEWRPLLKTFWEPFRDLVAEKTESVSRIEARAARVVGVDPKTGLNVSAQLGTYGPYVQLGEIIEGSETKPKRASLRPTQSIATITLEEALKLFELPRLLGEDEQGRKIKANIGRFGPYVQADNVFASLPKGEDPYEIDLARAIEIVVEKEAGIAARIIKEFDGGRIKIIKGRFGPYTTDGERNGKIPKDRDPESFTLEECEAAIAIAPPPKPKRGAKKTVGKAKAAPKAKTAKATGDKPVKKAAAKKAPAKKKAASKKPAAKKTAVKKTPVAKKSVNG